MLCPVSACFNKLYMCISWTIKVLISLMHGITMKLVSDVCDPLWYFLFYCTKVILPKKSCLAEANGLTEHLFHGNNVEVMMV